MQEIRKYFFAFLCISLLSMATVGKAMPPILTTQQLQPGMIGVAQTVVRGNQIESFNVKIIGVQDNGKGSNKQILAEAYGSMIDDTNGVIHGMSGSPVYVNGYLIGAVARGIGSDTNPRVFFITPIEDMLAIWDLPDAKADEQKIEQVKIDPFSHEKRLSKEEAALSAIFKNKKNASIVVQDKINESQINKKNQHKTVETQFVNTDNWQKLYGSEQVKNDDSEVVLSASGFYGAGLDFLKKELQPFNMRPYATSMGTDLSMSGDSLTEEANISPGSSVGVALTYGDFSVGAVGTVTAVDNNRILAFGHPFSYKGNVNYFMVNADIVGTASGMVNGEKVSSFGKIIGRINQDRYAGISGILGQYPSVVPIRVSIDDEQNGRQTVYAANIAYNEDLLPGLASSIAYAALDRTIDSLGIGTADVKVKIMTNVLDNSSITRSNMYYNGTDVGQFAVSEMGQMLNIICSDNNKQYDVTGIDVNMIFSGQRKTASIIKVIPDKVMAHPGDRVNLKVILQPYRSQQEQTLIPYTIPKDQSVGNMTLEIRGGGLVPVIVSSLQGLDMSPEEDKTLTAADKIRDFLKTDENNEIIVAPAVPVASSQKEQKNLIQNALKLQKQLEAEGKMGKRKLEPQEIKATTNYIIDNVVRINLNIKR